MKDDQQSWNQLERYIRDHSDARFSHGMCPDCFELGMQEMDMLPPGPGEALS